MILVTLLIGVIPFYHCQKRQVLVEVTYIEVDTANPPQLVTAFVGPDKVHRYMTDHGTFRFFPDRPYPLLLSYQWGEGTRHWDGPLVQPNSGDRIYVAIMANGDIQFTQTRGSFF